MLPLLGLGKAIAFAKGLAGAKGATSVMAGGKVVPSLVAKAKAFGSGQAARQAVTRMAGPKLASFADNAMGTMPKTAGEIGMRVAPDAIFGTLAGVATPGDLGDKLIAGTAASVGGAAGGLVGRGLVGGVAPKLLEKPVVDITTEMIGGLGGDMAGQGVADALLRLKGGGTTPYEKMNDMQQEEFVKQIRKQTLQQAGLLPVYGNEYSGLGTGLDA